MMKLFKWIVKTYLVVTSTYFTIAFTSAVVSVKKQSKQHKEMLDYVEVNKDKINDFKKMREYLTGANK